MSAPTAEDVGLSIAATLVLAIIAFTIWSFFNIAAENRENDFQTRKQRIEACSGVEGSDKLIACLAVVSR